MLTFVHFPEVILAGSGMITRFYSDKGATGCFNGVVFVP